MKSHSTAAFWKFFVDGYGIASVMCGWSLVKPFNNPNWQLGDVSNRDPTFDLHCKDATLSAWVALHDWCQIIVFDQESCVIILNN